MKHELRRFYFNGNLYQLQHETWCDMFTLNVAGSTKALVVSRKIAAHILGRSFSHFACK